MKEKKDEEKALTGKDAILGAYKTDNPGSQEPDDASLYDFANERYNSLQKKYDDLSETHDKLNGANVRLAELVSKDPKLGAVLSMISGDKPKSFPYAIASVYGKEPFNLEGDALDDFEKGYQDNLSQLAESKKEQEQALKNIEMYKNTLSDYGKEKSLSEDQLGEINGGIMKLADNILMGSIPKYIIEMVQKGLNYDKDVQDAADTGFVEGKNQKVEARMKEKTTPAAVPDFGNSTGANEKQKRRVFQPRPGSVYDNLKDIKIEGWR
ncbi:MAG: hypothetical protein FWD60_04730 [Candidatus Azobacteroides sp.]|nr:hypothetical protein [Candidatus Azobacteroides sp.]